MRDISLMEKPRLYAQTANITAIILSRNTKIKENETTTQEQIRMEKKKKENYKKLYCMQ